MSPTMLLLIQFLPLALALLLLVFPKDKVKPAAILALLCTLLQLTLVAILLPGEIGFGKDLGMGMTVAFGFDPLTALALIVITAASFIAILYSFRTRQTPSTSPSFYALILLVLFGTTGVALSRDLIQFYLFWEAMLIPAWALVLHWNEEPARARYIGLKFFIITHIGAVLMLASILWIYSLAGTTNMAALASFLPTLPPGILIAMAALFIMGFIAKLAIFPFHTWLPDAYTSAVMPVTLVLVGVLTNIGVYALARFLPFFPSSALSALSLPLLIAALVTMFYGGINALAGRNVKRVVAYSSISQMGYVLFGFATLLPLGFAGSVFNLFNQAATKLALFITLGMVAEEAGTWQIQELGGWARRLPLAAVVGTTAMLSLVGSPPTLGFWPEFLTFSAAFSYGNYLLASLALVASILTAAYGLRLVRFVFFGPFRGTDERPLSPHWTTVLPLIICFLALIAFGLYPGWTFALVRSAISSLGFLIGG